MTPAPKLILIEGLPGSGKTTTATLVQELLAEKISVPGCFWKEILSTLRIMTGYPVSGNMSLQSCWSPFISTGIS